MGGDLRNHAQKLLKLSGNLLHYTRKLPKCMWVGTWGPEKSCSEASETVWKSSPVYKEAN